MLGEPYKPGILPHRRSKTEELARESSESIYAVFLTYKEQDDLVGMDKARGFLQMVCTRARRLANRRSGRKCDEEGPRSARLLREVRAGQRGRAPQAAQKGVDRQVRLAAGRRPVVHRELYGPGLFPGRTLRRRVEAYLIGAPIAW